MYLNKKKSIQVIYFVNNQHYWKIKLSLIVLENKFFKINFYSFTLNINISIIKFKINLQNEKFFQIELTLNK